MSHEKEVWILEDDAGVSFSYREILSSKYSLRFFSDLNNFSTFFNSQINLPHNDYPLLLIADIRLGDGNFLNYLTSNPQFKSLSFPLIVVSSYEDQQSLQIAFENGASEYLIKPFRKAELIVKIERVLNSKRRSEVTSERPRLFLDPVKHSFNIRNVGSVQLTSKEFQIASLFDESEGFTVLRREMMLRVWGQTKVEGKTLDVHLTSLRKKLAALHVEIRHIAPEKYQLILPE